MSATIAARKHEGKTVEWVIFHDPAYFTWLAKKPDVLGQLGSDAVKRMHEILPRADLLRIPQLCPVCRLFFVTRMWLIRGLDGGLVKVEFTCEQCEYDGGLHAVWRRPSFFKSDIFRNYDKQGAKVLIHSIKQAYFGTKSKHLNQAQMEHFFNQIQNFDPSLATPENKSYCDPRIVATKGSISRRERRKLWQAIKAAHE